MKKTLTLLLIFLTIRLFAQEATPPFWKDIQNFKHLDSLHTPPANPILFAGSSSFTRWTDVQNYFPGYTILNRGFGGSTLNDLLRYEEDVIFKYNPKQIVIYCGENDIASSDTVTSAIAFERFKKLYSEIRSVYPDVPVVYISMKPSPSRWHWRDRMMRSNKLIKNYLKKEKKARFVNVWKAMLGPDGKPKPDIFIEDNLHMNAKGYAIWQKILQPCLLK